MSKAAEGVGPLSKIKVVEMGSFIAGPFCGQLLADLGADVVKIEPPRTGDAMRQWGAVRREGRSLWWPVIARGKRSLTLDLRTGEGVRIARELLTEADVLIENFRPGTLEKWGLGPDDLQKHHPGLIVARVSGFGQTGPYAKRVGFGAIAEAMAGMRHLCGFADRPPPRAGLSLGDSLAGLFTALGVVAALNQRRESGRGQVVDVGITDAVLAVMEAVVAEHSATGAVRGRTGTGLPRIAPSNLYPTADGQWVLIAGNGDGIFKRLAAAMGRPELADDARYATHEARGERQAELDTLVGEWSSLHALDAILALLEEAGVPAGAVADASDVAENAHFRERGAVVEMEGEDYGRLLMQGVVPRLSETPGAVRWLGPRLGQHTDEILRERLGLDAASIEELRRNGIV